MKLEPGRAVTGGTAPAVPVSSATVPLAGAVVTPAAASSNSPLTTAKAGTTSSLQSEPKVQQSWICAVISSDILIREKILYHLLFSSGHINFISVSSQLYILLKLQFL